MKTLTVFAIAAWLGMLGFLAVVVAPAAFATLERPVAARFVSTVMPRYHWAALALGLVAIAGLLARRDMAGAVWLGRAPLLLVVLMLALTAASLFLLLPEMEGLRDTALAARAAGRAEAPEVTRFGRLHALSSLAGVTVLAAGAVVLVLEAVRSRSAP
jgi:uncharacterized membrane protein